ncbi:hypothetical protein [Ferrovibrio sp.]|uniref:hypothetical protein n=1 Tax=Ferrovibrio sp. TaxID=1917215 RepID=UPI0025BEDD9B|nr:hypothetical protein [Ferrovibrio sp.]
MRFAKRIALCIPAAGLLLCFLLSFDFSKGPLENVPTLDNISSIFAALIAVIGFPIVYRQLVLQSEGNEIQTISQIQTQIETGWAKIKIDAKDNDELFGIYFGQLCNTMEFSCYICNHVKLEKRAKILITDFLCQNLVIIQKSQKYSEAIAGLIGTPTDFIEIRNFLRKNRGTFSTLLQLFSNEETLP